MSLSNAVSPTSASRRAKASVASVEAGVRADVAVTPTAPFPGQTVLGDRHDQVGEIILEIVHPSSLHPAGHPPPTSSSTIFEQSRYFRFRHLAAVPQGRGGGSKHEHSARMPPEPAYPLYGDGAGCI